MSPDRRYVTALLGCLAGCPTMAGAQSDPQGLSANLPVRLKDAFVTEPGAVALQYGSRTSVAGDGRYSLRGGPALKLGLPGRFELSLAPLRQYGDASSVHGGLVGMELEWNVNRQTRVVPAFLIALIRQQPYGGGHQGPHEAIQLVATKSLGAGRAAPRLGMEIAWTHSAGVTERERPRRWLAGLVTSRLIGPKTALVLDLVRQQQDRRDQTSTFLDAGVNHVIGRSMTLSGGLGPGLVKDVVSVRVFAGIKWTFKDALSWQ